jgi:hypothetical protein
VNEIDLWSTWVTGGFAVACSFWAMKAGYQVLKRFLSVEMGPDS